MALASAVQWEVRSTGAATNGGGFKSGATGTDWTQQDSAQYSVTDGVANGTTTITSATAAFGTDVVGNVMYVQGGTGSITAGWYEITARNSATSVTVDRSTGLTAGTGVTLKIGGALSTLTLAAASVVAGNTVWMKTSGGYTSAATITLSVDRSDGLPVRYEGYTTTRGDGGQAVITSTNSAATSLVSITGNGTVFKNFKLDGASLSLRCLNISDLSVSVDNVWALGGTQYGIRVAISQVTVRRCLATGNGSTTSHAGFAADGAVAVFDRCVSRDNAGNGFSSLTAGSMLAINCIAHTNTLSGFGSHSSSSEIRMINCTSYGNTLDGLRFAAASTWEGSFVRNCIFYGNAGYGMNSVSTDYSTQDSFLVNLENNAFGNNTLGARFQVPTGASDITLTADPFLDASNDDFGLNLILGGGLSLRAAGVPGTSGFGLRSSPEPSDANTDVGAVQTSGTSTGSVATMRSLWRELTGEKYSSVVPDSVVDIYIQRGLEELNRRVRYHYTDDTTGVTLVAGTQEYGLPAACNDLIFVYWQGQELKKADVDQWRRQGEAWRQQSGAPREWAMYGEKLVLFPTPDAAAVAASSALTTRYGSNPGDIGTYGPAQLRSQDYPVPVYRGVELWSASYPDSALAQSRLERYGKQFEAEAALVEAYYTARRLTR